VVKGLPADRGGVINQPLARIATRPPRYGVVPLEQGGKPALTRWRLLRRFEGSSLLLLQPRTGRSHQLRVHLADLGHPVLGDPIYGDPLYGDTLYGDTVPAPRLQLHAAGLQLLHPATGKPLHLRSRCFGDGLVGVDPLN